MESELQSLEDYSYETMKQIRLALHSHVDLLPFVEKGFSDQSLEEIRLALEEKLKIEKWLVPDMYTQQIHEIRIGLEKGIDVETYATVSYNWLQMKEIRKGLEEQLDVSFYARPLMEHKQMQEVRFGLEAGIDVSSYCDLTFTAKDMRDKRLALVREQQAATEEQTEVAPVVTQAPEEAGEPLQELDINVMLEGNGTKASIYIPARKNHRISERELLMGLKAHGIISGVIQSQVELIVKKQITERNMLIAEGQEPVQGKDGWYEFFVRTDKWGKPAILPDGSVDYASIDAIEPVEVGQLLAVYHPAEQGAVGADVFGREILPRKGIEKPRLKGNGFALDKDKVTYRANKKGKFNYSDGKIEITDMIIFSEDVSSVSGKIEVDGTVCVKGSVRAGAYIKATGDIIVENNVEAGELIAGNSILIKRGCCSQSKCCLQAGDEVAGKFFESVTIKAGGNVRANYIMNSQVSAMGKVLIAGTHGMLLGGKTHAMRGIEVYNTGNSSNLLTVLDVGKNETYQEKLTELKQQKEKKEEELHVYEEGHHKLPLQTGDVNPKIEDMRKKIEIAMRMKRLELQGVEDEIKKLNDKVEKATKMPVTVLGTAYAGTMILIDGSKYLLYHDVKRVSFKRKEKTVEMRQV